MSNDLGYWIPPAPVYLPHPASVSWQLGYEAFLIGRIHPTYLSSDMEIRTWENGWLAAFNHTVTRIPPSNTFRHARTVLNQYYQQFHNSRRTKP